jgi:hypothetical protein
LTLKNKNILLISPEPWNHIFVSKHHYATYLAKKGNKVFYLDPPSNSDRIDKTDFENLFSVHYNGFIKGLRFFPQFLQKYLIGKKFEQLQHLCKVQFDIVWSFDNSVFFDFSALPEEVFCISHIVDLNQDFEFKKAAKTADLCLGVCKPVVEKLKLHNNNSFYINHGFNEDNKSDQSVRIKLPGKERVKAFYAGNLNIRYLDWDLVKACVNKFSNVDFVFAGPWMDNDIKDMLSSKNNFYYLGVLSSSGLSKYYQCSDILLITYKYAEFPDQLSNSHKMMEYLGSGKMILATWTNEYKDLAKDNLIKMSKNTDTFLMNFQEVICNLDQWNSFRKEKIRKDFANQNTYVNQIEKIQNLINNGD